MPVLVLMEDSQKPAGYGCFSVGQAVRFVHHFKLPLTGPAVSQVLFGLSSCGSMGWGSVGPGIRVLLGLRGQPARLEGAVLTP